MGFSKEGNGQCQIKAADLIDPRFQDIPAGAFEVMLTVVNEQGEEDAIYLEMSTRYGTGNNAQKTQAQMSMESLMAIGWTGGADFSQIGTLVNRTIPYHAKRSEKNGKSYLNVYISKFEVKKISAAEVAARVAAMTGQRPPAAQPQPVAPPPASPFGQTAPAGGTAFNPFAQ